MIKKLLLISINLLLAGEVLAQDQTKQAPADTASTDVTLKKVKLEKTFRVTTATQLDLVFQAPVTTVILTGWDRNEVQVKADLEGKYLQFTQKQENNSLVLVTEYLVYDRAPFARGTVEIKLPRHMRVQGHLAGGEVHITDLTGETLLETALGSITGSNLGGKVHLVAQNGYTHIEGGAIEGDIMAMQGGVIVKNTKGKFNASGPVGQFSVASPNEMVEGEIEGDSVKLIVKEGDVQASSYQGKIAIYWKGDKKTTQRKIQVFAEQSDLVLQLPDGMGVDAFMEQVEPEEIVPTDGEGKDKKPKPEKKGKLESDFDLGSLPQKKDFIHQGKKHQFRQVQRKINGGGNQIEIRAIDSNVSLKKIAG